jgi:capsular exopolysaccharide synthesis family protein
MNHPLEAKLHFLDYWRIVRVRWGLVVLVFLVVVIAAGVATYFAPRQYKSFSTIEVQPDMMPVRIFDKQTATVNDPKFAQTQFQIITRQGILYPVIEKLNLESKWRTNGQKPPREIVYKKLLGMISLQEVRNTNLIQINVFSTDPQEAAVVANTIAQVYMEQRISEQQDIISTGLEQLQGEVREKEDTVNQAYAEASRLRTEAGIIDPNPDSLDSSPRVEDSSVLSNQLKVNEIESQVATLRSRVAELDRLKSEDLMRAAGQLNLNDPIIEQKLPVYQTAVAEKARMLNSGFGHNHPDVKAIEAQIDILGQQLREQINSLRTGLATQLAIAESSLKAMQQNLAASQKEQQDTKTLSARYVDAKYRYIQERKLLETAKTRLNNETMERTMPKKPAFIRDLAEPALEPSRPNVRLNIALGIAVGLILGVAAAFFIEYLDTSMKTMEDIEKFLELPVLAVIPKGIMILSQTEEDTADAEAYRILKTNVDFNRKKLKASTISILSGGAAEGKSTTVCNLATTFAAAGQRVLIIDADMRRPSQHHFYRLDNHRDGLSNYIKGEAKLEEVIRSTAIDNLQVITSGSAATNVARLLDSEVMHHLVDSAKHLFDIVLVDCPPFLGVSDAFLVSSLVDASIMVVQHRRFPRSMLLRVKQAIEFSGLTLLGVVFNNVDVRHDPNCQHYTSYNNYYTKPKHERKATAKPRIEASTSVSDDEY